MRGPMIRSEGFDVAGLQYNRFRLGMLTVHFVAIPLWQLSLVLGAVVLQLARVHPLRLRRRRRRLGLCLACGYDLRGSEGRCPECGTIPVSSA